MDNRTEIRDFLVSRRARLTPEAVGLVSYGRRRVPGLRREEVAQLAGVSVDYYTRLERGDLHGASEEVLDSLARALRLHGDERSHLLALARAAGGRRRPPARRRGPRPPLRPGLRALVDGLSDLPACVSDGRMQLVATNRLARALYAPLFEDPAGPNHARFAFLDPRAADFWVDWQSAATEVVGALRAAAARNPLDRDLSDLIGELSTRSDHFRRWWAAQDVYVHRGGLKRINHPVVGRLDLSYEVLHLPSDPDLSVLTYSAEAGTPSRDALDLLATWAATEALDFTGLTSPAARGTGASTDRADDL